MAEIDPKLAGLVLRAIDSKPVGIKRYARGQKDILVDPNGYDYKDLILAGWTHEQMVEQGIAEWA